MRIKLISGIVFVSFFSWSSTLFSADPASIDRIRVEISGQDISTITQTHDNFTGKKVFQTGLAPGTYTLKTFDEEDDGAGGYNVIYSATKEFTVVGGVITYVSLYDMDIVASVSPAMAGGEEYSLVLKNSGNAWAWGNNSNGELGDGSSVASTTPVAVDKSSKLYAITSLATRGRHVVALRFDGTVWTWGDNDCGQLGNGGSGNCDITAPELSENVPVQVVNASFQSFTGVSEITAGQEHSVALRTDGTVWAWGNNNDGQLGLGPVALGVEALPKQTVTSAFQPFTTATAVSAGFDHTLALKDDGTVWAWGRNTCRQLAFGINSPETSPVPVDGVGGFGNLSGITAISAGGYHSVALRSDGTVVSWGQNEFGQIGNGSFGDLNILSTDCTGPNDDVAPPVQTSGALSGVSAISAGNAHTLALKSDGTVWAWGSRDFGQVGDGNVGDGDPDTVGANDYVTAPVQVCHESGCGFGNLTGVIAIGAGFRQSFALKSNGAVFAWGDNDCGQLGNGLEGDCNDTTLLDEYESTPVQVLNFNLTN